MLHSVHSELGPFNTRTADRAAKDAELLLSEPMFRLAEQERQEVVDFAYGLTNGSLYGHETETTDKKSGKRLTLGLLNGMSAGDNEDELYPDCLDGIKVPGIEQSPSDGNHAVEIIREGIVRGVTFSASERRVLRVASSQWYAKQLAQQLAEDATSDAQFSEPDSVTINYNPETLLTKWEAVDEFKTFFKKVGQELLAETPSHATEAKRAILDIYTAKLNNILALLYPRMVNLRGQLAAGPQTELAADWNDRLLRSAPLLGYFDADQLVLSTQKRQRVHHLMRRLDLLRQGAVRIGDGGDYSAISPVLANLTGDIHGQ